MTAVWGRIQVACDAALICAALIHEPSVLFLDEPTTGLDPMSRMSLWEEIRRLNNDGTTVLLTTQYLEKLTSSLIVAIIDNGKIVREGRPEALKTDVGAPTLLISVANDHVEPAREVLAQLAKLDQPQKAHSALASPRVRAMSPML